MSSPETTPPAHVIWPPRTWGLVIGLFTASIATLIGLFSQLAPETILLRSLIGGTIAGFLACITAALAHTTTDDV